jgi:multisubunit Na+/H+ antiporter MnhG subunit
MAVVVALAASFWLELEAPSTAAITVAILAAPTRGQALEKACYRLLATLIGVSAAIAIVGLFSQARDLILAAFAAWLGPATSSDLGDAAVDEDLASVHELLSSDARKATTFATSSSPNPPRWPQPPWPQPPWARADQTGRVRSADNWAARSCRDKPNRRGSPARQRVPTSPGSVSAPDSLPRHGSAARCRRHALRRSVAAPLAAATAFSPGWKRARPRAPPSRIRSPR